MRLETGWLSQYRITPRPRTGWPRNQVSISAIGWNLSLLHTFDACCGIPQPPNLSTLEIISPELKWPKRETDHSPLHHRICIYSRVLKCYYPLVLFLFGKNVHLLVCFFVSSIHDETKFSYSLGATRLCLHGTADCNGPFAIRRKIGEWYGRLVEW